MDNSGSEKSVRHITRRTSLSLMFGGAASLALGHKLAFAQDAGIDKLVADAKAEQKVVVYTAGSVPVYQEIADAFTQAYGIKVELLEARASEIFERIRTEQSTNNVIGDIVYTGSNSAGLLDKEGLLAPYGKLPNASKVIDQFPVTETLLPAHVASWALLVNTGLVSEADEPKSWKDVLDPKWQGKILMDDPRALGGGQVFFAATYEAFGKEFHERLRDQKPVFSRDYLLSPQRVARGEYPLYMPMNVANYLRLEGLPVKLLSMAEGNSFVLNYLSLLKNAPHQNAARLLMNYFLEAESQLKYPAKGWRHVITGLDDQIPSEKLPFVKPPLLGSINGPERAQELLDIANEIYK